MIKADASIRNLEGFDIQFDEVRQAVDDNMEEIADFVKAQADLTAKFADKDGYLRKANKKKKSKFEDGGFIVLNRAPHAHLVEFGHVQLTPGGGATELGRVPARPFMRSALEDGIRKAVAELPRKSE